MSIRNESSERSAFLVIKTPLPRTERRNPSTRFWGRWFHQFDLRQGCFVLL